MKWWRQAEAEFDYAKRYHASAGRLIQCLGLVARAATCAAHAVLAARRQWVTNEKQLFVRAGLGDLDRIMGAVRADPIVLRDTVDAVRAVCLDALEGARASGTG